MTELRSLWGRRQALGRLPESVGVPEGSGWRLDLPAVPQALTTAGVAWLQGLRQAFAALGAEAYDPGSQEWDPGHDAWLFTFSDAEPPAFDPRCIDPLPVKGRRWIEAAPGLWVHPKADAVYWARYHTVFARWPIGQFSLSWPSGGPGEREPAVVTRLRRRLERVATGETALTGAPAGYIARQYDWFGHGKRPPKVRP